MAVFSKGFLFLCLALVAASCSLSLSGCGLSAVNKKEMLTANLHYQLGLGFYRNGDYVKAMQEFIRAKESNPDSAKNYNAIAMVYMMTGREGKAVRNLKKAVGLDAEFSDAYYNLGIIYIHKKDYASAEKSFKKALKNNFYDAPYESYTQLAKVYLAEKKYDKAEKALKISMLLNGQYVPSYYYMGKYYMATGDLNRSLKSFGKVLSMDKFFTAARYQEGVVFFMQKKYNKAKEVFSVVYNQNKSNKYGTKSLDYLKKILIMNSRG